MKRFHKNDFKKIGHATRVARYAERLGKEERGNLAVILIASYLLSIPLKRTEPSILKTPPGFQEDEGRPVAKEILTRLGARDDLINDVCEIIRRHHQLPRFPENMDAKIVYDADRIAELEVEQKDHPLSGDELARIIDETLLTESGRKLAASVLGIAPPTT
jgi:HD superfamily phosphodiesterase